MIERINSEGRYWCWRCQEHLDRSAFPEKIEKSSGYGFVECTVCRRLRRFKLTKEQYQRLPGATGNCPLCLQRPGTHIDHDHTCCPGRQSCGKCVRAVICTACNLVVGRIEALMTSGVLANIEAYIQNPAIYLAQNVGQAPLRSVS